MSNPAKAPGQQRHPEEATGLPPLWNKQTNVWYQWATEFCDYPGAAIGDHLGDLLRPADRVIDAGAGTGAFALWIAPRVQGVVAVDSQAACLAALGEAAAKAGLDNVATIAADWLDAAVEPADVTICAYAPGITRRRPGVLKLVAKTKRAGLILTPRLTITADNAVSQAARRLGVPRPSSCANGCREHGWLTGAGCDVDCRPIDHDLSQPVRDLDDAWAFFQYQTRAEDDLAPRAKKVLAELLQQRAGTWYIPIVRHSCLLTFRPANRA